MLELNQDFITHLYLFATSFLFGLGQWMMKIRKNEIKNNLFDFCSEILFAELAGFITLKICQNFSFGVNLTWILVAINSWSGSKFLDIFQKISSEYIAKKFDIDIDKIEDEETDSYHSHRSNFTPETRRRRVIRPYDEESESYHSNRGTVTSEIRRKPVIRPYNEEHDTE